MPNWTEDWNGGRTYLTKDGATVYVLRRQAKALADAGLPARPAIVLGTISKQQAEAELALYLRDPVGYVRHRQTTERDPAAAAKPPVPAIYVDPDTVGRFLEYLRKQGRSERYVKNVGFYLAWWAEVLHAQDFRNVTLQQLKQVLNTQSTARKNRITALKSLTAWLREEEATLGVNEDPTLALKVPAARPEKARRFAVGAKKGYDLRDVERLYAAICPWESKRYGWARGRKPDVQSVRDVLLVHAKTGLHATEIERLAKGEGSVKVLKHEGQIAGTITFIHKSGRIHVQSIDAQTLAAVQRLQARKAAPVDSYIRKVVRRAADSIGMTTVIRFGELRHSFVTWAKESGQEVRPKSGGLTLDAIAAVIGHQSIRTTDRYYNNVDVPPMIRLPINLFHPDDPALPKRAKAAVGQG